MKKLFIGLGKIGCEIIRERTELSVSTDDYFFFFSNEIDLIKEYSDIFEKRHTLHNNIFIFNIANGLNKIINSFDMNQIREYFNAETYSMINKIRNGYNYGAGNFRIFNRIQFEYFSQKEYLRKVIQNIISVNDVISIVIVSSLCGSFGSSFILPLAAKLKSIIMDIGVNDLYIDISIIGITAKIYNSIFPDAIIQYAQANTYATVKEIQDVITISDLDFKITIPEIYDSRKNQNRHINQFLIVEQTNTADTVSLISDIANLLLNDTKKYINSLGKNGLKQADILSDTTYIKSYYSITTQVHIDNVWEKKKLQYKEDPMITVFLSYCNADNDLADIIDKYLMRYPNIKVSRYTRDVGYKGSFKDFMKSLSKHDYVITLISDSYLKSRACMYEIGELIKDSDYKNKILFIVVNTEDEQFYRHKSNKNNAARIYEPSGIIQYIKYWENKYDELCIQIKQIESESAKIELLQVLREIRKIIDQDLSPFLQYLSDARGRTFHEMYQSNFLEIIKELNKSL